MLLLYVVPGGAVVQVDASARGVVVPLTLSQVQLMLGEYTQDDCVTLNQVLLHCTSNHIKYILYIDSCL